MGFFNARGRIVYLSDAAAESLLDKPTDKFGEAIVAGGGAIEMELSRYLREYLRDIQGKSQLVINGFAKALETIPRTLAENSGMNSTDILNKLRQKHAQAGNDGMWYGVNVLEG